MIDGTNLLLFLFAAALPTTYVLVVSRWIKLDSAATRKLASEPGQTDHTAHVELH